MSYPGATAEAAAGPKSELTKPAEPSVVHFPGSMTLCDGQSHPHIRLAQAMLRALHQVCPEFLTEMDDGTLCGNTAENLRHIQRCAGLPATGELDKVTWNRLCMLYRAMFDRYHAPTQG